MAKRKGGRRSKYHTHVEPRLIEIEGWARDGVIDEDIAKKLGVAISTFHNYKKQFPELMDSLKKGKEVIDRQVENALLKSALGFHYHEEMVTNQGDVVEVTKFERPNTTAQIFWLKNRKPEAWRDKQEVEQTNKNINIILGDYDDTD